MPHTGRHTKRLVVTALVAGALTATGVAAVTAASDPARAATCNGYVALTFDDGPNASNTNNLLAALKKAGVRATLFNIGQNVQNNQALAKAQTDAGMWVGNHSWTHPHMANMSSSQMQSELSRTNQIIQQATGTTPKIFRPPYGETNGTLQSVASQLGLKQVTWDVDSQDWNGAGTAAIVQAANSLQNGGIILMHDQYQTSIAAIPQIVSNLTNRGLCPGMISPTTGRAVAPDDTTPTTTTPAITPTKTPTITPSATATRTSVPSSAPTAGQGTGTCTATYRQTHRWGDRFNGEVAVTANGAAISTWNVAVALQGGQRISTTWNGSPSWTGNGTVMTMKPQGNGSLAPEASTSFGFTVMANGTWTPPTVSCSAH